MADNSLVIDSDEQLKQDLLAFGETVPKITDKNRLILEKKLNHLRARRRQSEKLSQSMLVVKKSPVKASKGRGKKKDKHLPETTVSTDKDEVNDSEIQSAVDVTVDNAPPEKKVKTDVVSSEMCTDVLKIGSKTTAVRRGRKSAMPNNGTESIVQMSTSNQKIPPVEQLKPVPVEQQKVTNAAVVTGSKRRKPTTQNTEKTERLVLKNDEEKTTITTSETMKRRTYSCGKTQTEQDTGPEFVSRIPKYTPKSPGIASMLNKTLSTADSKQVTRQPSIHALSDVFTHIIDSTIGSPAINVCLTLETQTSDNSWKIVATGATNEVGHCDIGRCLIGGTYRLHVESGSYFGRSNRPCFYPFIDVVFNVEPELGSSVNIQLVLSQYGFSTHRI